MHALGVNPADETLLSNRGAELAYWLPNPVMRLPRLPHASHGSTSWDDVDRLAHKAGAHYLVHYRNYPEYAKYQQQEFDFLRTLDNSSAFLEREQAAVDILVEELVRTWREINQNPAAVVDLRAKYNLLPDLPKDLEPEVLPYFESSVASGTFPNDGGGADAARADFEFNSLAGKLEGDPATLVVEEFWELGPLDRALAKLGPT